MDRPTSSLSSIRRRDAQEPHPPVPDERATRSSRTLPTGDAGRRLRPNQPDQQDHSDAAVIVVRPQEGTSVPSTSATPTMADATSSREDYSADEAEQDRSSPPVDLSKARDSTTPTLIDEVDFLGDEEEEQEMISLERERLRRTNPHFFGEGDDSYLRRTPGARMCRSQFADQEHMRRTPGATQMHRSAVASALQRDSGAGDSSGLGFGLTLSTPVASGRGGKAINYSASWDPNDSRTAQKGASGQTPDQVNRPPLPPGSASRDQQRGAFVAPWSLTKPTRLDSGHGAYSPNTLRLTEDLGNLLLEDEGDVEPSRGNSSNHFVFGSDISSNAFGNQPSSESTYEVPESWTAPYVISMDAPSRVPRSSSSRGRRGKTDGSRRSRGYDRSSATTRHFDDQGLAKTGGFLQYPQQPKAVRQVQQPHPFEGDFSISQIDFGGPVPTQPSPFPYSGMSAKEPDASSSRFLHFGGAFAPLPTNSRNTGFNHPAPSAPNPQHTEPQFMQSQISNRQPNFQASSAPFEVPSFHDRFQSAGHTQFHPVRENFHSQYESHGRANEAGPQMTRSPTFGFPPQIVGYPMQGGMHPPQQNFVQTIPVLHHQHPPAQVPQFGAPPQVWPPAMDMRFEGIPQPQIIDHDSWHAGYSAWPVGDYGYGVPRAAESPVLSMTPTPSWTPEPDLVPIDAHTNPSAIPQPPSLHSASPSLAANKAAKKNQRKGVKKGVKGQTKNEKSSKVPEPASQLSTTKKGKKKQIKDRMTPPTQPYGPKTAEEVAKANLEDPDEAKRAELSETPATRSAFKDFYRRFRSEERLSFQDAEAFALRALSDGSVPETIHWKVYLELADLAKRANKFGEARKLYQQVCSLQPFASQGWLEFSKLEEECGNMTVCAKILRTGLEYCQYSENMLTRAIKLEEKMGNLSRARELLSRLKHVGIEKVWRTVLEGALLEARAGNDVMARRVLKYLMHHVPWYGPLYLEAYKLEHDLGRSKEALEVVERGLAAIPRYGPLWFGAFRLCEQLDQDAKQYDLPRSLSMVDRATYSISKELVWKVHLEAAQMLERSAVEYLYVSADPSANDIMDLSRKRFAMTILTCPPNLRWKVWLASGRMEAAAGNADRARRLFSRAHKVVPDKGRAVALLECARLEEFVGDVELAKAILSKSRHVTGYDWKVWLESVLLEIRCGNRDRAVELAELALQLHSGTGRLWASLVQLRHHEGEKSQFDTLKLALNAVPKSGEVWCEGARIHLNPFSRTFDIPSARRHLTFATQFTPQFGDGFLEILRLEIVDLWLVPIAKLVWDSTRSQLVLGQGTDNDDALWRYVYNVSRALCIICNDDSSLTESAIDKGIASLTRRRLQTAFIDNKFDISALRQRCANADPNYGALWFFCRGCPTATARSVLAKAKDLMLVELRRFAHVYLAALIRRFAILARLDQDSEGKEKSNGAAGDDSYLDAALWEGSIREKFLAAPSLKEIFERGNINNETGMELLESCMTGSDFVAGLVALSEKVPTTVSERRKALFGTDALFS